MFSIQNYTEAVSLELDKHREELTETLKQVMELPFLSEVELLNFQVFKEPMHFELTIMYYAMDRAGNEIYYEEMGDKFAGGSEEVAEELPYYQLPDDKTSEFEAFRELHEDAVEKVDEQVITNWFASCWKAAGGNDYQLPAYVGFQNDYKSFDIKQGAWLHDNEKWTKQ